MNKFENLSAEQVESRLAHMSSDEVIATDTTLDTRIPCLIKLVDDGDEDRTYWRYEVIVNGDTIHSVRVVNHDREAAYIEAAQWANDKGLLIQPNY